MSRLTHGSLFAGYEGLGMAVNEVFGSKTLWFSEFAEGPSKILAHHWPNVPNLGDITQIDWDLVVPVDIMSGGSPCQDISTAGHQAGMTEGTRSNLWVHMREGISVIRPLFVVWENVQASVSTKASSLESAEGLLDRKRKPAPSLRVLGRVCGDLASLGYDCRWVTLPASGVGACHQRKRVFLLAWDSARIGVEGLWPEGVEVPDPPAEQGLPGRPGDRDRELKLLPTPSANEHTGPDLNTRRQGALNLRTIASLGHVDPELWQQYTPAISRQALGMRAMPPHPVEPNTKGGVRLSARFVEWVMWLPEGHVTEVPGVPRTQQLMALGNGVVPVQAVAALRHLLDDRVCSVS